MIDYRSLTRKDLENWATGLGLPAFRGRQLFRWLWKPGFDDFSRISDFPRDLRKTVAKGGFLTSLVLAAKKRSRDGTVKLAWKLSDGFFVESVIIPEEDRTTLCVSTQVGCAMGCRFCSTARMGFGRNLTSSEIAGQVLSSVEYLGSRSKLRNLVFMGMGEPLANYDHLLSSLSILTDNTGLDFSTRRITVSTCGLVPEMLRLGEETVVGLAVSLHAADDDTRNRIMPINRRYPVATLMDACRRYPISPRRRITFEYLLLAGVNDSPEQAWKMGQLLRGIPAKINLIPYNEGGGFPFSSTSDEQILAFQRVLIDAGYTAIIRKSRGRDISAACGQLCAELA